MEITATVDLQRQTYASLAAMRKHNKHSPNVKHKNAQIFSEDTELNGHYDLLELDRVLKDMYGDMIKAKNANLDKQFSEGKLSFKRYKERKTDIYKWLNQSGKPKQAFTTWVVTLGNAESNIEIMNRLGIKYELRNVETSEGVVERPFVLGDDRKKWSNFWKNLYVNYAKSINGTKDFGFKITAVDVHLDEGGAPHAHLESVNSAFTNSGKPSYNLDNAIKQSLTILKCKVNANSRENFKTFRSIVDDHLVKMTNADLKNANADFDLNLHRKRSEKTGLSMEDYKAQQQDLANLKQTKQELQDSRAELLRVQQWQRQLEEEKEKLEQEKLAKQAELKKLNSEISTKQANISMLEIKNANLVNSNIYYVTNWIKSHWDKINEGLKSYVYSMNEAEVVEEQSKDDFYQTYTSYDIRDRARQDFIATIWQIEDVENRHNRIYQQRQQNRDLER